VKSRQPSNGSEIIRPQLLDAINKVCSRWGIFVLGELLISPRRFNELRRRLPFVPARSLVSVLKKLEKAGLVDRRVDDSRPPSVTYLAKNNDPVLSEINKLLARWESQSYPKAQSGTQ
jgi:DNA-binding HxlR family transcriptional regulator